MGETVATQKPKPYRLEEDLSFLLNRAAALARCELDAGLAGAGVSAQQWPILLKAHERTDIRPSEIADAIGIDRGAVTRLIDRLVDKGLIERRAEAADQRAIGVRLTRKGRRIVPRLSNLAQAAGAASLARLPRKDARALVDLLTRFAAAPGANTRRL